MAFIDIKNQVLANVIDLPPAVSAAVPGLINTAIRSAERRYNFKYMEQRSDFVTVPAVLTLGTISRFKEYRDRGPYLKRQYAPASRIYVSSNSGDISEMDALNVTLPGDRPRWITNTVALDGTYTLSVAPYPDALSDWDDGNYRVHVPFYQYSAPLVADADTNWLVVNGDDYIAFRATAEAFMKDWDYNSMLVWKQQDQEKFKEIQLADKRLRLSGIDTFVPYWEGAEQGMVRR